MKIFFKVLFHSLLILKRFKMRSMAEILIICAIFMGSPNNSPLFKFCVGGSIIILCSNGSVTPTQSIVTRIYQIKSIFQPFNFSFGFLNLCMELITITLKKGFKKMLVRWLFQPMRNRAPNSKTHLKIFFFLSCFYHVVSFEFYEKKSRNNVICILNSLDVQNSTHTKNTGTLSF